MQYDGRLPEEPVDATGEGGLREFALLLSGLALLAAAIIGVAALAIDLIVPIVPPDLEARWFGGVGELLQEDEDPRSAPVQALVDRLAAHWIDHPYAFRIGVLDEVDPNALALPGGAILVTSGLLEQVASENELALVLGHELGHYRARDHLRGLGRALALQLVLGALGGEQIATGLAGLAGTLAQRGFDRRQESEADAFGLALVYAEYGHVAGSGDFFTRLAKQADESEPDDPFAGYLATHPLSAERAQALRAEAEAHGWASEGPLTAWVAPAATAEATVE